MSLKSQPPMREKTRLYAFGAGFFTGLILSIIATLILTFYYFHQPPEEYNGQFKVTPPNILEPAAEEGTPVQALGFSSQRFQQVGEGMSKDEIIDLLGEPLEKKTVENQPEKEVWSYTSYSIRPNNYYRRDLIFEKDKVIEVLEVTLTRL